MMISRVVVSGAVALGLAGLPAPVLAQPQEVARLGEPAPQDRMLKQAVTGFEQVLVNAVIEGGKLVQDEVRQWISDISLRLASEPSVSGVPVENVGYVFDVQCPEILESQLYILNMYQSRPELVRPAGSTRGGLPADYSAGRSYGNFVADTLRDAMVDFSSPLSLGERDVLVVVARVPSSATRREMLDDSRKLILQVRGADLRAYRDGTLSREDLKLRIVEQRF